MSRNPLEWLTAFVSATIVAGLSFYLRGVVVSQCGGEYIYPIDDTYIHIAMAKNLALHGVWGVEPDKLAFCSSSPLWTLLLGAVYGLVGVVEDLPWWISLLFNLGSVVIADRLLARIGVSWPGRAVAVLGMSAAAPYFCTTALGMEHAMHGFFMLATVVQLYLWHTGRKLGLHVALACAFCATAARYESLFFLLPLGCGIVAMETWQAFRRKSLRLPQAGLSLLLASVAPVFVYGLWAVSQGGHFLPNSLLLKGSFHTLPSLIHAVCNLMAHVQPERLFLYILAVALTVSAFLRSTPVFWRVASLAAVVAVFGQMLFAAVGQLCRYEAYLTALGVFLVSVSLAAAIRQSTSLVPLALSLVLALGFCRRTVSSFMLTTRASSDIYSQQVQMTRMIAALPEAHKGCVALNDLGYLCLHGACPILDLWGLGSQDSAEWNIANPKEWTRDGCEMLMKAHDVKYVVVFDTWFPLRIMPEGTVDVAALTLEGNTSCGGNRVVFRATSRDSAEKLHDCLERYREANELPARASLIVYPL